MKRILVTGAGGYIGRSIATKLKHRYDVTAIRREDVDLLDGVKLTEFITNSNFFDVVIHCAIQGGSRLKEDGASVLQNNLTMYSNLSNLRHRYGIMINIGSGAEFDRRGDIGLVRLHNRIPIDPYGMSKYFIAQHIRECTDSYNLRIYGIFDENELETRFIKSVINNTLRGRISQVRSPFSMSFIYMDDFIWMLEKAIGGDTGGEREFDCVYPPSSYGGDLTGIASDDLTSIADYILSKNYPNLGGTYDLLPNIGPNYYQGIPPDWVDYSELIGLRGGIDRVYDTIKSRITWHE